jgi:hypothetical protein
VSGHSWNGKQVALRRCRGRVWRLGSASLVRRSDPPRAHSATLPFGD